MFPAGTLPTGANPLGVQGPYQPQTTGAPQRLLSSLKSPKVPMSTPDSLPTSTRKPHPASLWPGVFQMISHHKERHVSTDRALAQGPANQHAGNLVLFLYVYLCVYVCIHLAAPGLSYSTQALSSSLHHGSSSVVAYELSVTAHEI